MERLPNIHPGEVLLEDFLKPLGMTQYRLAQSLGLRQIAVSEIVRGKRSITPTVALLLGRFFRCSPQFWLNLQNSYDLEEVKLKMDDRLNSIVPVELPAAA